MKLKIRQTNDKPYNTQIWFDDKQVERVISYSIEAHVEKITTARITLELYPDELDVEIENAVDVEEKEKCPKCLTGILEIDLLTGVNICNNKCGYGVDFYDNI
jgi:hypothetical protein